MDAIITFLQGKKTFILAALLGVLNAGVVVNLIGEDQLITINEQLVFVFDGILAILIAVARSATSVRASRGGKV